MTDDAATTTGQLAALIRDLVADLGLAPDAAVPDADLAPVLAALEAASPGGLARLEGRLGARLARRHSTAVAAGAVH